LNRRSGGGQEEGEGRQGAVIIRRKPQGTSSLCKTPLEAQRCVEKNVPECPSGLLSHSDRVNERFNALIASHIGDSRRLLGSTSELETWTLMRAQGVEPQLSQLLFTVQMPTNSVGKQPRYVGSNLIMLISTWK